MRVAERALSRQSSTTFAKTLSGLLNRPQTLLTQWQNKLEQYKKRLTAACSLPIWFLLSLANVVLCPYAFLFLSNLKFHWNDMRHRMGTDLVVLALATLAFPVVAFGLLWWAAARHQKHASWPTRATASRKCRYLLFSGYGIAATITANGIPSWSIAAQSQVFIAVYLAGGFAVSIVLGTWIADRIGRSMMVVRFNKPVPRSPVISVLADSDPVCLIFADGSTESVPETNFKDKKEILPLLDTIVAAASQRDRQRILLVTESGDIFTRSVNQ
jgi:hypothetical protein